MDDPQIPGDDAFGVTHVVIGELPPTIGTPNEPDRYDVAAVFTRRPTPEELRLLASPEVTTRLHDAGYPDVALKPVDRRLVIERTNLAELADGLAPLIGEILSDIGRQAEERQREHDAASAERARGEERRAADVLDAAKRIDFRAHRSIYQ
ncbi:hypothetical protein [Agromyces larvae]|uniref:Uncharacterized protein n=1 Tax=Agromyces larvae TaxID=2929802 RepID=A0ABY4C568_9MICO|nr:hypothetical protein [Agromyces larvae]UOE45572.1 hypothetical protein MTO99_07410 [Agromyces larvae]